MFALLFLSACQPELAVTFPDGFRWGVATSAFQVEGGAVNDYSAWADEGGAPAVGNAVDNWNRWQEDLDLAASLGIDTYRLSIEWARIEPERDVWDSAALEHYRQQIQAIRDAGLEPMVTLHHYTNPLWLVEEGPWLADDTVEQFRQYAAYLGAELGDLVDLWNPSNEPMLYATGAALAGLYPGGRMNDGDMLLTMARNLIFGHAACATALRENDGVDADGDGQATSIWAVTAAWPTWPADPDDPEDVAAAAHYDWIYNHAFVHALVYGELDTDLDGTPDSTYPELADTLDVIGLNYYSRTFVVAFSGTILGGIPCLAPLECGDRGELRGDNDNEVYPEGLYDSVAMFARYGLPMAVTENGMADSDDDLRPAFIVSHLQQLALAIDDGFDLRAYLHWSLLDNYEWLSGFDMQFGLWAVDPTTYKRSERVDSVGVYRQIVDDGGLSQELLDTWL